MDPRTRMEFKEMLKELCAEGKTILVSSHILSELSQMCTDIGIIDCRKVCPFPPHGGDPPRRSMIPTRC